MIIRCIVYELRKVISDDLKYEIVKDDLKYVNDDLKYSIINDDLKYENIGSVQLCDAFNFVFRLQKLLSFGNGCELYTYILM